MHVPPHDLLHLSISLLFLVSSYLTVVAFSRFNLLYLKEHGEEMSELKSGNVDTHEGSDGGVLSIAREQVQIEKYPHTSPDEDDQGADDADAERTIQ